MTFAVSASQVEDFYTCERKWGLRRLARYEQNIGAFRGDSAHKLLEAWGRDRTPPEQGEAKIAAELRERYADDLANKNISAEEYAARIVAVVNKMIPLLPDPPWERVEGKLRTEVDGVLWVGRIDLEYGNEIDDHKITSSPDFALTEETIRTNVQALIYAHDLLTRKACTEVKIGWTYGQPGARPRAWRVETTFTPDHVREHLLPHNETAKKIVRLRTLNPNPLTLTPNWKSCSAYGGCEFQHICQPTAEQLMSAYLDDNETRPEKNTMGLLSQLQSQQTTTPPPATTPAQPPPASTSTPERSDTAHVLAECSDHAKRLLGLGIAREEVLKALKGRYIGLPNELIESCVPGAPAINPPSSPAPAQAEAPEAPKEEPAKRGRKASTAAPATGAPFPADKFVAATDHVLSLIGQETDAEKAAQALYNCASAVDLLTRKA